MMREDALTDRRDALLMRLRTQGKLLAPLKMNGDARPLAEEVIELLDRGQKLTAVNFQVIDRLRRRAFRLATLDGNGQGARLAHDVAIFLEDANGPSDAEINTVRPAPKAPF